MHQDVTATVRELPVPAPALAEVIAALEARYDPALLQTLPSVAIGLYTRWLHRGALIAGWAVGMAAGMLMLYNVPRVGPGGVVLREHWGGSAFSLGKLGLDTTYTVYAGFLALVVNLLVTVVLTFVLRATGVDDGVDGTAPTDYTAEREDPSVRDLPDPLSDEPLAGPPPGSAGASRH